MRQMVCCVHFDASIDISYPIHELTIYTRRADQQVLSRLAELEECSFEPDMTASRRNGRYSSFAFC